MQEYTSPGEVAFSPDENLTTALFEAGEAYPTRPAFATRVGNSFQTIATRTFVDDVVDVARGLIGLGVQPGDRFCIMSPTRYEWTLLDYAIWAAGAVSVPIYETSSPEQVQWIVSNSEAVGIVVADADLQGKLDEVSAEIPTCKHQFVLDEGGLDELKAAGADVTAEQVRERAASRSGEDLATLVYTSGTTGRPKGVELTHGNFIWDATQVVAVADDFFKAGESTLLFLPLAHIFARIIQVGSVRSGVLLAYSTGIPQLLEELQLLKPSFLLAVPRVFEKVFNGAQQRAHSEGKGAIFDRAADVAIKYSREQQAGKVSLPVKLQHAVFDKLVYGKLRDALGGRVRYAVSGGAALGERLGHFFNGIGVTILEGYGLTETTAGATINSPRAFRIGTVGRPLPGATVRIADDGEVLIKSGGVLSGYYKNDEATRESIDGDGWFHSGDLGSLDNQGFLSITGRKKEIIVTAGGKNVAPAPLEDRIRSHFLVSQAMVVGDDQPFIAALITIDPEAFEPWAEQNDLGGRKVADVVDDERLTSEVQKAIDDANRSVSKAESIRTFRILPEDFEIGVELSQKQSVKRHVVSEKYADAIAKIYAGKQNSGA